MLGWLDCTHVISVEKPAICELQIAFNVLQDDLTPLLLAVKENKQHIVEFLVKKKASIHAVDQLGRYSSLFFQEVDKKLLRLSNTTSSWIHIPF